MLKKEKGITLIALIITIIVMLILVGVTINVALNGGVFSKAEQATSGTEKQAIYEQIISNMEIADNGKISVKGTFDKVVAEFGADKVTNINPAIVDENTTEVTFSVVGKTGTYNYRISAASIEKDTVQTPVTTGSLVYGKIYEGDGITVCYSKDYNYVLAPELSNTLLPYVYNEEDKTIVVANTYTFQLSENGTSISGNIGGKDYTVMLTDKVYEPKEYVEFGVYEGIYYSSHNKKIIKLDNSTGPEDSVISIGIWIEETDEKYTTNNLSNYVTVIDSKHIERNGITYELLEAGEFK